MMNISNLETLFERLDQAAELLKEELQVSYIEALAETVQNLVFGQKAQQIDGKPSDSAAEELNALYQKLNLKEEPRETARKVLQLAFIKAIREDHLQPNHQLTPDTIAYLIAYLISEIKKDKNEPLHIHDLAVGTGNLLAVVIDFLQQRGSSVTAEAVDNDDLLIAYAANCAYLENLENQIQFTHSDSLQKLLISPADLAVSDLPIGYYPVAENAQNFETAFQEKMSYAHFLLIEQHFHYLKESGWGFFIVPHDLFETDEEGLLMQWLRGKGYLQAVLTLPETLFQSKNTQKAILILQKEGKKARQAKQVLLGTIPDIKNAVKMKEFLELFHNWTEKML